MSHVELPMKARWILIIQHIDEETVEAIASSIEDIHQRDNNILVNIAGNILFNGTAETVNVCGKTSKQEALFTDNSGSLHLVLWEQDIRKMETGQCYTIPNVAINEFNAANYLTLTKHSTVNEADKLKIDRQDDVPDKTQQLKVQFPPDRINYVQSYLSCNKCHSKTMLSYKKIIKCSECGLMQLKSKCRHKIMASILMITGKDTVSLNIFDDMIKQLYSIKTEQDADFQKEFADLDDDDITERILTVEATLVFNDKNAKEV